MARFRYGPDSIRALSLETRIEMMIRYTEGPETADQVAKAYGLRSGQFVKNFARNHTIAELTLKRIKQEEAREAKERAKLEPKRLVREKAVARPASNAPRPVGKLSCAPSAVSRALRAAAERRRSMIRAVA